MQTDTHTSTDKGNPQIETSSNLLGLTDEDIDYIRHDMFEYSKSLGYGHDAALRTANLAAETLVRHP
jgi:hypothetical protein